MKPYAVRHSEGMHVVIAESFADAIKAFTMQMVFEDDDDGLTEEDVIGWIDGIDLITDEPIIEQKRTY